MADNFILSGYWKLPEEKLFNVAGTLTFDLKKGISLSLLKNLCGQEYCKGPHQYEFIHGYTSNGKYVTLYKCNGYDSYPIPGFPTSDYYAEYLFVGILLKSITDLKITKSTIHYSYLDEWVNIGGFINKYPPNRTKGFKAQIKYKQPRKIIILSDTAKRILLWFSVVYSPGKLNAEIIQKVYLNINFKKPFSFYELLALTDSFRNFLSFGTSRRVSYTELALGEGDKSVDAIKIFFKSQIKRNEDDFVPEHSMLFSLSDIKKDIRKIYKAWLKKQEALLPVFKLYFDIIYNENLYEEHIFLNLITSLETYSRRTSSLTEFPLAKFEELKSVLIDAIRNEDKEWMKNKLKYMNEINLRKRLNIITDEFKDIIEQFERNLKRFNNKVVTTRNYLVHFDESAKNGTIKSDELGEYNLSLLLIL